MPPDGVRVTVNGSRSRGRRSARPAAFVENDEGANASALVAARRDHRPPGHATSSRRALRGQTLRVEWDVYGTGPRRAKNVILFIGDGLSVANRTAARILSKGLKEGRYYGQLSFDAMPHMALIGTSGVDSIITDSANAMSAYTTGHKSSVNALGVYVARNKDNLAHPKVETITELVKRKTGMAVGIVTDAEIEDATPAGMFAHTRRRADKDIITEQLFLSRADVDPGRRLGVLPAAVDAGLEAQGRQRFRRHLPARRLPRRRPTTPACARRRPTARPRSCSGSSTRRTWTARSTACSSRRARSPSSRTSRTSPT